MSVTPFSRESVLTACTENLRLLSSMPIRCERDPQINGCFGCMQGRRRDSRTDTVESQKRQGLTAGTPQKQTSYASSVAGYAMNQTGSG